MKIVISLADGATAAKVTHINVPETGEHTEEIHVLSAETSQVVVDVGPDDLLNVGDFA